MKYNEQVEKDIQEIMDEFNWELVHSTMSYLDWKWHWTGVPNVDEIKKLARSLLEDSIDAVNAALTSGKKKYKMRTGTGGFEATAQKFKYSDKIYLELKFVLTERGNY